MSINIHPDESHYLEPFAEALIGLVVTKGLLQLLFFGRDQMV